MYIKKEYIPTFFQKPPTKSKDIRDDDVQGNSCMDCLHPTCPASGTDGPQVGHSPNSGNGYTCASFFVAGRDCP